MEDTILKLTAKFGIFLAGTTILNSDKVTTLEIIKRNSIFLGSLIINRHCIAGKKIFNVFEDEETNDIFQQYVFALSFQIFMDSIFVGTGSELIIDTATISAIYGGLYAIKKGDEDGEDEEDSE